VCERERERERERDWALNLGFLLVKQAYLQYGKIFGR
jgi:hypothetical protein